MPRFISTQISAPLSILIRLYSHWQYWLLSTIIAFTSITVAILVPALLIPSNSTTMVLAQMQPIHYLLLGLLAAISGTLVSLNMFMLQQSRLTVDTAGSTSLGTIIALTGSIFASSCGCGVGFVFGFLGLGLGGVTFLIANQIPIMLGVLALALTTLYLATRAATKRQTTTCSIN